MKRLAFLALVLMLVFSLGQISPARAAAPAQEGGPATKTPIQHLVFVMQENHTFDNYFGTYPGADGLPANVKMPIDPSNPSLGFVQPWHIGDTTITDLTHNVLAFRDQFDNGKMDGFVSALDARRENGKFAMGYYDDRDIPYYWNLADHYVLFDRFFSSAPDGSFVNHVFAVAAVPPGAENPNSTNSSVNTVPTIFDKLQAAGVSWKFYVQNYDPTINYRHLQGVGSRGSQVIWVPLLNMDRFIDDPNLNSHIVDLKQYYIDLQKGTLPAVSYIVPSGGSEHPPQYPGKGQRFIKSLIQELMRSDYWKSSAFVLAYDDWGGWYDHVVPPRVDANGYGFRVVALLVSPYAREAYIDHTVLDFTSILKFIEVNWGVAPLATRDASANDLMSAFDFQQQPRPAQFIPLARESVTPVKAAPTRIIYGAYGLALAVAVLVFAFAFARSSPARRRAA
jgi:phospholipase C